MKLKPMTFCVADLTKSGEIHLKQEYQYALLEQIEGASELISLLSSNLWRSPEEFEVTLFGGRLSVRWCACSPSSGLLTLRNGDELASLSILLCGLDVPADAATLQPLQLRLVRGLHDTGFEPAFDLVHLHERPLLASINFSLPSDPADRRWFTLADRCFAASYFRKMGLA
jgi:hypothetical protein